METFISPVPFPAPSKKPQIIACTLCRVKFHACLSSTPEKSCCSLWNITLCSSAKQEAINHQSVFQLPLAHSPTLDWYFAILISLLKDASSMKYYRHFIAADNWLQFMDKNDKLLHEEIMCFKCFTHSCLEY